MQDLKKLKHKPITFFTSRPSKPLCPQPVWKCTFLSSCKQQSPDVVAKKPVLEISRVRVWEGFALSNICESKTEANREMWCKFLLWFVSIVLNQSVPPRLPSSNRCVTKGTAEDFCSNPFPELWSGFTHVPCYARAFWVSLPSLHEL